MNQIVHTTALSLAMLALAAGGIAHAQDPAGAQADRERAATASSRAAESRELAQAHAELARATARVAELSRQRIDTDPRIAELRRSAITRPVLGVVLASDDDAGVRVSAVTPGGAADEAGLRAGDRLVSIGGTPILGSSAQLRLENARKLARALEADTPAAIGYERDGRRASVQATPKSGSGLMVFSGGTLAELRGGVGAESLDDGSFRLSADSIRINTGAIADEVSRALAASGLSTDCDSDDCGMPMLLSAFRWSGLNLASVDARLGRYFGTDSGVLVLTSGTLEGLEPGDVIRQVDGKTVTSPREVMNALRDRPTDSAVSIAYMRDREQATADIAVPRLRSLRIPAPPEPPRPPQPAASQPATPPAPAAPPQS